jgi:uncharacterized protein
LVIWQFDPVLIALLQFDLLVHGAASLKDKRRVVLSVKDRLHREHMAAVAEVGGHETLNLARMGLALVGNDEKHLAQTLDRITAKLRTLTDAELGDTSRSIFSPTMDDAESEPSLKDGAGGAALDSLNAEMLARGLSMPEAGGATA